MSVRGIRSRFGVTVFRSRSFARMSSQTQPVRLPRVIADGPLAPGVLALMEGRVELLPWRLTLDGSREPVDAIYTYGHPRVDGAMLDRLPGIKVISNYGVGVDHINPHAVITDDLDAGQPIQHRTVHPRVAVGVDRVDRLPAAVERQPPGQQLDPPFHQREDARRERPVRDDSREAHGLSLRGHSGKTPTAKDRYAKP